MSQVTTTKILPWGEEIYMEIPITKKSRNMFYARHGKTAEGREYLEFSKFGPKPNTENENYSQKLRIYNPLHWAAIKSLVEGELSSSIGWDLKATQRKFEALLKAETKTKKQ